MSIRNTCSLYFSSSHSLQYRNFSSYISLLTNAVPSLSLYLSLPLFLSLSHSPLFCSLASSAWITLPREAKIDSDRAKYEPSSHCSSEK